MTEATEFSAWCTDEIGSPAVRGLSLATAFCLAVCRIEEAVKMKARDPISTVGNSGSASTRQATRSMLMQLGYTNGQSRVVQRLLAGSAGGWPGLIRLYLAGRPLTRSEMSYARRQVRLFWALDGDGASDAVKAAERPVDNSNGHIGQCVYAALVLQDHLHRRDGQPDQVSFVAIGQLTI